ncbi:unnamed protein product [Nippostrongylus brasiliensis]|uniref:Homeobox protein ceh-19 (inferred by orthology to a C. elegans protein) n=1 Tax=Nippostrongylus brasiliensis TaxID=27835 RepID=A0A0N4XGW0_NIPBR|nr:unnamed protein product [Nippostrongylus brasiliensis]
MVLGLGVRKHDYKRSRKSLGDRKPRQAYTARQLEKLECEFQVPTFNRFMAQGDLFEYVELKCLISERQISQCAEANSTLTKSQPNRNSDQNLVPESEVIRSQSLWSRLKNHRRFRTKWKKQLTSSIRDLYRDRLMPPLAVMPGIDPSFASSSLYLNGESFLSTNTTK